MSGEPATKRAKTSDGSVKAEEEARSPWRSDCADVISFHLVDGITEQELKEQIANGGQEFEAEFFHQHFGDDEQINGYKGLSIKIWFSTRTYHVWIDISHSAKKLGADQLMKVFNEHFPAGIQRSQQDFISAIVKSVSSLTAISTQGQRRETLQPKGQGQILVQQYTRTKAPKEVQELHARFEPLLLFFIDGASLIDKDDDKWEVLLALQPRETGPPALLGMATLYHFWAYPDTSRMRLSQILVLPPFRELGLGKALLAVAYKIASEEDCVDLTLEDPTPDLQRVREKLEVEMLKASPWVMQQASACASVVTSGRQEWPAQPLPLPRPRRRAVASSDAGSSLINALGASSADAATAVEHQPTAAEELNPQGQAGASSSSPGSAANNGHAAGGPESKGGSSGGAQQQHAKRVLEGPVLCLVPSAAFLTAITNEFKIYTKEARLIWESILFLEPGLWDHPVGQAALTTLIRTRIETQNFALATADAERKQVVPIRSGSVGPDVSFIMMKVTASPPATTETGGSASTSTGEVATGRLSVTTMSVEEKEEKMSEMCDERLQQLKTLKSLLARTMQAKHDHE